MAEQTPQDIAADILAASPWIAPGGSVATQLAQDIAAAIASKDAEHAAEVARVRRETRIEDAHALCTDCYEGRPVEWHDKLGIYHHPANDFEGGRQCDADDIQKLIARDEEAANER